MSTQAMTKEALEMAYKAQVAKLYGIYVDALITARNDEQGVQKASNRFRIGLESAMTAFVKTTEIASIA